MGRWDCFRYECEIILAYIDIAHGRIGLVNERGSWSCEERGEYYLGFVGDRGGVNIKLGNGYCDVILRLGRNDGDYGNGGGVIEDQRTYFDITPVCEENEV